MKYRIGILAAILAITPATSSTAQQIIIQGGSATATATGRNATAIGSTSQQARHQTNNSSVNPAMTSAQWGITNSQAIGNNTHANSQVQQQSNQTHFNSGKNNFSSYFSRQEAVVNSTAITQK
jgi:hypothetical protein